MFDEVSKSSRFDCVGPPEILFDLDLLIGLILEKFSVAIMGVRSGRAALYHRESDKKYEKAFFTQVCTLFFKTYPGCSLLYPSCKYLSLLECG